MWYSFMTYMVPTTTGPLIGSPERPSYRMLLPVRARLIWAVS